MKKFILAAALTAVAAPALADINFAIAHFNQDQDSASDLVPFVEVDNTVTVSSKSGAFAKVVEIINASEDSAADRITGDLHVVSGTPAYAADIFARLAEESREGEN